MKLNLKLLFVSVCLTLVTFANAQSSDVLNLIEKYGRVLLQIRNSYIDTVDFNKLVDDNIRQALGQLDPHSAYLPKSEAESEREAFEGSFDGIGIEFAVINDTLNVQAVIAGGPSEAVGLRSGDKIIAVDGHNIAGVGISNDDVRHYLRGPRGTKVELTVARRSEKEPLSFTIVRNKIPINSVDAAYCPKPGVIYIKLSRFAQTSVQEFVKAMSLVNEYPKGVIIDLRGNGGGLLQVPIMLANIFLETGETIVYTEGRTSPLRREVALGNGFYKNGPLVVLVDENSASASEILAGALQDWDRAVIVGRRTFGKGLVQQQFPLPDGSQMRLTVARYHTPCGRVIQSPYEEGHRDEYYESKIDRYRRGESFSADSISFPDSLKFSTLKQGRTVYGGGGIMPDVFVPADTVGINEYYTALFRKGLITDYMNEFCDKRSDAIEALGPDFESFDSQSSSLESEALSGLVAYADSHGLRADEAQVSECERLLRVRIKALMARKLFNLTGYYRVVNSEDDPEFRKALEIIESWNGILPSAER